MLFYRRTSLLESSAQTLVNTVNCVGVMGKGLAKEFKDRDPEMFRAYKRLCDDGKLEPGKLWLWRGVDYWTLNFPTKKHWRHPSKLEWIEAGLKKFASGYEKLGIREISFPRLGCGNGGLDWDDVRPLMEKYLIGLPLAVYIHDYTVDIGVPEHLEAVHSKIKEELVPETYYDFITLIRKVVSLADGDMVDIKHGEKFSASVLEGDTLRLSQKDSVWDFDSDTLWTVWIGLQKGLLSSDKMDWVTSAAGRLLMSILAILPGVRPIEVQEASGEPQIAVEYKVGLRKSSAVQVSNESQLSLSWR